MTEQLRAIDVIDALEARWAPTLRYESPAVMTEQHHESVQRADDGPHTGVMVAFYPTAEQAAALAIDGGEAPEQLHMTLAYLGNVGQEIDASDEARLVSIVSAWAATQAPIEAIINGIGLFTTPENVTWASVDAPDLPDARQDLIEALEEAGLPAFETHGYTPHITLLYGDARQVDPPSLDLLFDAVVIAFAGARTTITLTGTDEDDDQEQGPGENAATSGGDQSVFFHVSDRPSAPTAMLTTPTATPPAESSKAFVADINGRTLITAPASTIAAMKDPTVEDITAAHMLWMHGRFVGAEAPNRNGAFWSAGDLQMGKASVVNGPLNWLHDARHVIGTLAKADYVNPATTTGRSGQGVQRADGPDAALPHITATAAIWKWIYPDEAYVIQQASEQQMLWYSMECISKEVSCVGATGCGNTTSYSDYMAGAACEHVRQRASVRRFIEPVFLGGAVIVPPTRPGWAEADARVMKSANAVAEAAFEAAGRPDVPTSTWEQLMAQLVRFADA